MLSSLAYLVAGTLFALYVVREVRTYLSLRQFSGPPGTGFSRLWILRTQMSGEIQYRLTAANDKYGSTFRAGPQLLITKDPELIKKMNAVRSSYTRGLSYEALRLHPERDNITSYRDEEMHATVRNQMAMGYSGKENALMEQDVDTKILELIDFIRSRYLSNEGVYRPMDLSKASAYFTLDVISTVAFGRPFGFLQSDTDLFGYIANLRSFMPALMVLTCFPEFARLTRLSIMQKIAPQATDAVGIGRTMGFANEVVAERFGPNKITRRDMLGSFLSHGLTQQQLESETLTQITAGSDSSATAIRMTLYYICTNPSALTKLLTEFDTAVSQKRITRPIIKDSEARNLPYLQACIKEGLRLYAPVTGLLHKQVGPGGDVIDGKFAPEGTAIGWNSWGIEHDKSIFGEDADIFRPERWILDQNTENEKTKDRLSKMEETVNLVFGYGRFGCLGRNVAYMELNKIFVELLSRFTITPSPSRLEQPFKQWCGGFFLHDEMMVRICERQV